MKIALIGYGNMGHMIEELALQRGSIWQLSQGFQPQCESCQRFNGMDERP